MNSIGIVGLGNMGSGIAKNLCLANFTTYGFDLSENRLKKFESYGGHCVTNVKALPKHCKTIFIMVMNKFQLHSIIDELIELLTSEHTIIVTATIEPSELIRVAKKLEKNNINLIDSPVSGGLSGAENATLTLMLASKNEVLEKNRKYLEAISSSIHHVSQNPGDGQTIKAALQILIGVTYAGIFEAVALGAKSGLSGKTMFDVFTTSGVRSPLLENCMKLINDRTFEKSGSHIDTMHKDLGISTILGREKQVPLFTANSAYQLFESAKAKYPHGDNWIIVKLLEEFIKTEVKW